jgi:nucleotide-binding universal stress UspA family protein
MPSEQIDKFAQEVAADLIVVGTRGRSRLETILLGSTAERVIKAAPYPVFAVPAIGTSRYEREEASRPKPSIQHILTALDFSSPSLDALEYAIQVARQLSARMTLFHVLEPMYYEEEVGLRSMDLLRSAEVSRQSAEQRWQQWVYWRAQFEKLTELVESIGIPASSIVGGGVQPIPS